MNEEKNISPEKSETENQKADVNKIITPTQTTETPQASTENMDVHHHPDLHHKKKNFKEYFLEFLMIFLAVTLGFIAEDIREHISDRQREKEYIVSLISNLQDDTAQLKRLIKDSSIVKGVDTLMTISKNQFLKAEVQDSVFYYSLRYLYNEQDFQQNDFTIIQLRNAGGYRLIRKDHVADSIAAYERHNNDIKEQAKYYEDEFKLRFQYFNQIFDSKYSNQIYNSIGKVPGDLPVAVTADKEKINLYYNQCFMMATTLYGYKDMLNAHFKYLNRLINFLKKEYDLSEWQ